MTIMMIKLIKYLQMFRQIQVLGQGVPEKCFLSKVRYCLCEIRAYCK